VGEGRKVRRTRIGPHISVFPDDVTVMSGTAVNLTCQAVGRPTPNVSWHQRVVYNDAIDVRLILAPFKFKFKLKIL